jgi:hypothetical protein
MFSQGTDSTQRFQLTYADIALAHIASVFEEVGQPGIELVARHALLSKHKCMVFNQDGIKRWVEVRPKTSF